MVMCCGLRLPCFGSSRRTPSTTHANHEQLPYAKSTPQSSPDSNSTSQRTYIVHESITYQPYQNYMSSAPTQPLTPTRSSPRGHIASQPGPAVELDARTQPSSPIRSIAFPSTTYQPYRRTAPSASESPTPVRSTISDETSSYNNNSYDLHQDRPVCRACAGPGVRGITSDDNPNGNERRPRYTCANSSCASWICWDDDRGLNPNNPSCHCGRPSRGQLNNPRPDGTRSMFYACERGRCGWSRTVRESNGQEMVITPELASALKARRTV